MASISRVPFDESVMAHKPEITARWVETINSLWPITAETLLRTYILEYRILDYSPKTVEYRHLAQRILCRFIPYVDRNGWRKEHGQLFFTRIVMKIEQWRGLTIQDHLQSLRGLGIGCLRDNEPLGQEARRPALEHGRQQTTGPTRHEQVMTVWESVDSRTQSQIFRAQLRAAKCPNALIHEMTMFWNEKYGDHPDDLPLVVMKTEAQALQGLERKQAAINLLPVPRRDSQPSLNGPCSSIVDLTQISESVESRRITTLEDSKFGDFPTSRTPSTNVYREVDRVVDVCADKHLPGTKRRNSQSEDIQTTTKAYREALANLRKDKKDIFAMPAYKQPQCPKETKKRDQAARGASMEEISRSPAWLESNCEFPSSPKLQDCQAQGKMVESDRSTEEVKTIFILPPLEKDLNTAMSPPLRPLLDMRALLEGRLQEAQSKRTRKAEEDKSIQENKRIKLEASCL